MYLSDSSIGVGHLHFDIKISGIAHALNEAINFRFFGGVNGKTRCSDYRNIFKLCSCGFKHLDSLGDAEHARWFFRIMHHRDDDFIKQ